MQDGAEPSGAYRYESRAARPIFGSLMRGAALKCPACGAGAMFRRYLKVADACPQCGEELHHHRADDAPPYFTIVIVGHIVVSLVLMVEMAYRPPALAACGAVAAADRHSQPSHPAIGQGGAHRSAMGAAHARLRSQR